MVSSWWFALAGGGLLGLAGALLFLTHGRIAGVSGIAGGLLPPVAQDRGWRVAFVAGLVASGTIATLVAPHVIGASVRSWPLMLLAGLLVGFGTSMGSGCTSGHGVCGLSRGSVRSLAAVMTFMLTGALTAWIAGGVS
jgi:uncharacterized protein